MFLPRCSQVTRLIIAIVLLGSLVTGRTPVNAAGVFGEAGSIGESLRPGSSTPVWLNASNAASFDPFADSAQDLILDDGLQDKLPDERAINTSPWSGQSCRDFSPIIRAQSPDGCGCTTEGLGCGEGCFGSADTKSPSFRLTEFNIYPTFSYLDEVSATYNEFEFASQTDLGFLEMENRTVLNVADLPGTIALGPTNPGEPGAKANVRASGFGDILSGFFFSPKGSHERDVHIGVGPVITFPTASDDILGSSQYTAGPGIHASADMGKLTTGFFMWQSWGFGEDAGSKKVNQLFGKPFIIYEIAEKWDVIYIPLGLSHSWDAKSGDDWTVPVGGGFRRRCTFNGQKMGLQAQAFDYVARKSKDPEWELRFTIEFLFD